MARRNGKGDSRDSTERHPFAVARDNGVTRVWLEDSVDRLTIDTVGASLLEECERRPTTLQLDLSRVTFLDAAALHLLVALDRRLAEVDGALVLSSTPPALHRLLRITGIDQELTIEA